ncbi:MAG: Unknown protein [uncultured Sulfurovum sp.]|uniref:Uncharacterized protein n=1 Tax=uncultured Sulfurovum sp. TaxID=269237 RepID=A0A6S6SCV0_9BACT|nr:MAG: Unknown protein [uncultured Sulfurovum sp.]
MPHIVLEKAKSVRECYDAIDVMVEKIDGGILKITDKYINAKETSALLESVTVDKGKSQSFFIQLSSKGDAVTVRLLPLTDPEKTKGVKQLMGIVAKKIKELKPEISYGKTNLQDFIGE